MKTALLHYWLTNMRGGEKVFAEIAAMFPQADIFTHAYNQAVMDPVFGGRMIHETFIGRFPGAQRHCQCYLPLMPLALSRLDLSAYELLISSESGPVKGVRKAPDSIHICYCHTPMRYIWDMYEDYYRSTHLAGKISMRLFRDYLRHYDRQSAGCVDQFVANSQFVAERIKRIYQREAQVIYPPVETEFFSAEPRTKEDYYLLAGQLVPYKHPELAVSACTRLNRKLIVTGTGPMLKYLQNIAGPAVKFCGHVSNSDLRKYYAGARALLFPGIEDFGIVPVEAQAAGTPVIAIGAGGALETVIPGKTGLFFDSLSENSLIDAIRRFEKMDFSVNDCRNNALRFSPEVFREQFSRLIDQVMRR